MKAPITVSFTVAAMLAIGACAISNAQTQPAPTSKMNPFLAETNENLVADGRKLVVRECASCHAIDENMIRPRAGAPPMKTLLERHDPDMLAEDLIEGIRVGHDEMPLFDFNVIGADALIAYLKSIARDGAQRPTVGRGS